MSSVTRALTAIAVVVLLAAISAPITRLCPNGPCSTAPDADGPSTDPADPPPPVRSA